MNGKNKSTKGGKKSQNSSSSPRNARVQNKQQKNNAQNRNNQRGVAIAYSSQQIGKTAQVTQRSANSICVKHRELLGNVSGGATSAFTNSLSLECNPGLESFAPWLSLQAQGWETYRFKKLEFQYFTRTATTTVGSVIMAPDYDAADSAPPTEQIMSTYKSVVEDAPWKDIKCKLDVSSMHPEGRRKFIRSGPLSANLDIKTYDVANFFVNTVDSASAASWGKLWVEYEVEFYTPQTLTSIPNGVVGGRIGGLTSMTGALPFGTAGTVEEMSKGISYNGSTGEIIFEKTGTYVIAINYTGTTLSAPIFSFSDMTQVGSTTSVVNAAATSIVLFLIVTADATNARMVPTLTAATVTGSTAMIGCGPTGAYA